MREFTVRWCHELPTDECGDADIDNARYTTEVFTAKDAAGRRAAEVAPTAVFGYATISEWVTVSRAELDAELESDDCGDFSLDHKRGLIWLQVGEMEEVS